MSEYSFQIDDMDELRADLQKMYAEYPEEMSRNLYTISGEFTNDVNAKFPASYNLGKRPLNKGWKREREKTMFTGYTIRINVVNTAPHFHLVENGHEGQIPMSEHARYIKSKRSGSPGTGNKRLGPAKKETYAMKNIGFVPGKHYCEKTRNEWMDKYPDRVRVHIDRILRRHGL